MPDKDDLDLLLDSALSTYADPGPDAGLGANFEQRVLARIAAAQTSPERKQAPRRTWLPWAIALPLAAGLVLLLLLAPKINHSPSANTQLAHESAPPIPSSRRIAPQRLPPRPLTSPTTHQPPRVTRRSLRSRIRRRVQNSTSFQPRNPSRRRNRRSPSSPFKVPSPSAKLLPRHNKKSMRHSASLPSTFHPFNRPIRARIKETQMRKIVHYFCLLPLLLGCGLFAFAQDDQKPQDPPKPQENSKVQTAPARYYHVDFVVQELGSDGKAINSRSYTTTCRLTEVTAANPDLSRFAAGSQDYRRASWHNRGQQIGISVPIPRCRRQHRHSGCA